MLTMAEKSFLGLAITLSLAACLLVAVNAAEPKLHIYPLNQNPILAPAKVSFGLVCEGKAEEGEFAHMKWFNPKGEEIRGNVRNKDSRLKLTFSYPSVEDRGNYKCTAIFNDTLTLEAEVRVVFYEPIKFEECPEIQNLVVGQEGVIKCRAVANPIRPTISWEKDNSRINSDKITITEFGLSIPSVSKEDGGTYSLEAFVKETGSNLVQKIDVNVLSNEPFFDVKIQNVNAMENSYLEIYCIAEGVPPITYEWYDKNEEKVTSNSNAPVYVSNINDSSVLTISKVKLDHEGQYTCSASNRRGLSSKTFQIKVLPLEDDDTKGNDTTNGTTSFRGAYPVTITATSVTFAFDVTGPVERIEVLYNESRNASEFFWEFRYGDDYEIKELIPSGNYSFHFRIYPSGSDKWSRPYRVILLPDKPEVIFREMDPDTGTVKLQWNFRFDDRMRKTIDSHELSYYLVLDYKGEYWKRSDNCTIIIQIPECSSSSYTLSGLSKNVYYEMQLRRHTSSGYGEPFRQKFGFR